MISADDAQHRGTPRRNRSSRLPPLLAMLETVAIVDASDLRETILRHLTAARHERRVDLVVSLLRAAGKSRARLDLDPLHELCAESLTAWLSAPPRAADDWSIDAAVRCQCKLCGTLRAFLTARERRVLEWPLAEAGRQHIQRIIDGHELPVSHQTRKTGRPYTLVLTKREAVFKHAAARRNQWLKDLQWLRRAT
ncbi:MAG: hypothetical protein ABI779_13365 [Acidobacteriota bacterium]